MRTEKSIRMYQKEKKIHKLQANKNKTKQKR